MEVIGAIVLMVLVALSMGVVSGQATTFNLVNYVGELFGLTPTETPFLSAIGGLTGGGRRTDSIDFAIQTYSEEAAAIPAILEGADPTPSEITRAQVENCVQIFQEAVEVSYSKQADWGSIDATNVSILGTQPVRNELEWQVQRKISKIARSVDLAFLTGTYARPANNSSARTTRGMIAAVTTNVVNAASADLTSTMIDQLLLSMWTNGAPMTNPVIVCNGFQKQALSGIYGYAPDSRNVGGVNIQQIETDFGTLGVMLDRNITASVLLVADLAYIAPRILYIPGKGFLFREPLAKTGASDTEQIYGEIGLDHGPEQWHGKIYGLTTS